MANKKANGRKERVTANPKDKGSGKDYPTTMEARLKENNARNVTYVEKTGHHVRYCRLPLTHDEHKASGGQRRPVLRGVPRRLRRRVGRVGLWRRFLQSRLVGRLRRALCVPRVDGARSELRPSNGLGHTKSPRSGAACCRAGCIRARPLLADGSQRNGAGHHAEADYGGDVRRAHQRTTEQLVHLTGAGEKLRPRTFHDGGSIFGLRR